jgi:uncharacterized protein (TIGR02145 family)
MTIRLKFRLMILTTIPGFVIVLAACDNVKIWPTIATTNQTSEIGHTWAVLNGTAIIDNYTKVGFEYGTTIEYGTTNYDVSVSKDENNYANISCQLGSLSPNTTYHYRIIIKSSDGIINGDDKIFTTLDNSILFNPKLNYGSVTDIDGNIYKTIQIGTQIWMAENLKTTRYNDGTSIYLTVDNYQWLKSGLPSFCWLFNQGSTYKDTYGALYNFLAVNSSKLCPAGWHVPGDSEWKTMATYLGGELNLGNKIKEAGLNHWLNSGTNTTNESGFTALPGGYRSYEGSYKPLASNGSWMSSEAYWWSSTMAYPGGAYYLAFYANSSTLLKGSWRSEFGHSVRCVKD